MSKKACKKKKFQNKDNPKYCCKKCGAKVRKPEKVCKPQVIISNESNESLNSTNQ